MLREYLHTLAKCWFWQLFVHGIYASLKWLLVQPYQARCAIIRAFAAPERIIKGAPFKKEGGLLTEFGLCYSHRTAMPRTGLLVHN